MRTNHKRARASRRNCRALSSITILLVLFGSIVTLLFSSSSASTSVRELLPGQVKGSSPKTEGINSTTANSSSLAPWTPSNWASSMAIPQLPTSPMATYAADCITPKTTFVLGETVCAKATGLVGYRFAWVDSAGFIRQRTAITTDPQTDTFTLPISQTSVVNDTTVDNRGEWRVNAITSRGSLKTSAFFTVKDPANPVTDLSINKSMNGDSPVANGPVQFSVLIVNHGPDDAANVHFVDTDFTNATFNSVTQTEGPPFICTGDGSVDCTTPIFPKGSVAKFLLNFTAGSAGADLENTATVSSDTSELNPADNSFTTASIKVGSGAAPPGCVIECPDNINANANTTEGGQRGAHVDYPAPTSSGTCGAISSSPASGSFFPVGTTIVTATSETGNGSCSFTVTVVDSGDPPAISCPADQEANAGSDCKATVTVGNATATGTNVTVTGARSDGEPMYDCDENNVCTRKSTDLPFATGTTTITWTAYSHSTPGPYATSEEEEAAQTGSASCTQTVKVTDTTPPTITCPANITTGSDPGVCSATVNPGTATTTDNCEPTVTGTRSDGEPLEASYPVGTTTITWTASDGAGSASCTQTVTVNDTENPEITCPANITTDADAGSCSANVDPGTATATDNCGTASVNGSRSDGLALNAPYPTGTTTITWTATDGSGRTSSCTQTVTVTDNEPPAITCPANVNANTDPGECSANVDPGTATATDNCGTATVSGLRSDGLALNAPYPTGTTTITWTASDGTNSSNCTQTVTVTDNEPPAISCPNTITVDTLPGECSATLNVGVPTATDNCQANVIPVPSRSDQKPLTDPFPVGTTTITWTATDSAGNHSSCDQTIIVLDNQNPTIECPANITTTTEPGTCSAHVNHGTATATDNCGTATVSGTRSDGRGLDETYPRGTTTITWTATDLSGNQSSCSQTITVNDEEAPTISCPSNITKSNDPGTCGAVVNYTAPVGSDNCPGSTTAQTAGLPSGSTFPVGTTTNTFEVTDASGKKTSCSFTVTVNDTEAPTITTNGQTPVLWPANHAYHTFNVTDFVTGVSDNCDTLSVSNVVIMLVTSDELDNGPGSGNTFNDIVIAADCKSVQLRAERENSADGRVYTITFRVTDSSGNVGTKTSQVHVPKNLGVPVVDSGPHNAVAGTCP
jgi:HYR domain-containing protein/uncharacterized protein DUF11